MLSYGFHNFLVKYGKGGWTYQDGGVNSNFQIFESGPFQSILEAGLLKEEATQLAWASWAATSSPILLKNGFRKIPVTLNNHILLNMGEK